jgi:hypothetical protein
VVEIVEKSIVKEEKHVSRDQRNRPISNKVVVSPRDPRKQSKDQIIKIKTEKMNESQNFKEINKIKVCFFMSIFNSF